MLAGQPADSSRHLLLITDGDFGDDKFEEYVQGLAADGMHLHVLAIGTAAGGPVPVGDNGFILQQDGTPVISRLNEASLQQLARAGNGIYQHADYRDEDTAALLDSIGRVSNAEVVANQKTRIWNEHYYWLVALAMLVVLPMYRRFPRTSLKQEAS
jgi:Ca-activated chloride channel family protein